MSNRRLVVTGRLDEEPYEIESVLASRLREGVRMAPGLASGTGDCIVLSPEERDLACGWMSTSELQDKIIEFRGQLFTNSLDSDTDGDNTALWLEYFVKQNHTFGIIHAWATACYINPGLRKRRPEEFHESLVQFNGHRFSDRIDVDASGNKVIKQPRDITPRRIWDVCSHRVIPFEWFGEEDHQNTLWVRCRPISHSWTAFTDRIFLMSPVNNYQWPVPLPKEMTLETVREQVLKMNCSYSWLDVICLRQEFEERPDLESVRADEWKIDVPTIGFIYSCAEFVITYFNGLGRPFSPSGLDHERHWLKRVWTYQETVRPDKMLVGGLTSEIPHPLNEPELADLLDDSSFYNRIHRLSASVSQDSLMTSVLEMQTRYATTPVDIVASLSYITPKYLSVLPVYLSNEAPGDAWNRFIATTAEMDPLGLDYTFELIKWFPFPSFGHWFPSWEQLIRFPDLGPLPEDQHACQYVSATVHASLRIIRCLLFRHCKVRTTTMPLHELKYPFRVPPLLRGAPDSREMSISDSDSESAISTNEDDSGDESGPPLPVPDGDISLWVSDQRGAPESSEMSLSDSNSESAISTHENDSGDESGPPLPVPDGDISLWVSDEESEEGEGVWVSDEEAEGIDNLSLEDSVIGPPVPAPDRSIFRLSSSSTSNSVCPPSEIAFIPHSNACIPLFHITHLDETITLEAYQNTMYQPLSSYVNALRTGDPSSTAPRLLELFPPLPEDEDLTIMLLPCEAQDENVLVVCREPAETGPKAPEVLHLQRLTTLEWNIGKRGQYFFDKAVQLEGFLKAPDFVLGMEGRVDDNVEIYLL